MCGDVAHGDLLAVRPWRERSGPRRCRPILLPRYLKISILRARIGIGVGIVHRIAMSLSPFPRARQDRVPSFVRFVPTSEAPASHIGSNTHPTARTPADICHDPPRGLNIRRSRLTDNAITSVGQNHRCGASTRRAPACLPPGQLRPLPAVESVEMGAMLWFVEWTSAWPPSRDGPDHPPQRARNHPHLPALSRTVALVHAPTPPAPFWPTTAALPVGVDLLAPAGR